MAKSEGWRKARFLIQKIPIEPARYSGSITYISPEKFTLVMI
jgi:hypothetical protein